nr:immunoglobulin heavy chain junction region [Macaca mulatta]
CFSDYW